MFNGINMSLGAIAKLSKAQSRSISAENVYGEKGRGGMAELSKTPQPEVTRIGQTWTPCESARELGRKWKVRPAISLEVGKETTIMDIDGPGCIQHIWITLDKKYFRDVILRMYWDGESAPSVETPIGDFFCQSWSRRTPITALPINVNPEGGLNAFFPMPFRKHARVTVENRNPAVVAHFFYTINYVLAPVDDDEAYFHAQFRRSNPLVQGTDYTILDGVRGWGQYVGVFMAWQQNVSGWWGEGEIKFFLDGDQEFPTICGTGTEDYFGGAWCFFGNYSAPFMGYPYGDSGVNASPPPASRPGNRHLLYRFHVMDPIRFEQDLRVTIQALGWRGEGRYMPLQDDIASVAFWYQKDPHAAFPKLGDRDALEIIF
ncbi:MAG: DUF2961 domain-containing protein [Kiritimatiellae bacterium]|nr:DUF2961 domain-containing protein [Kiritimatiellia bacterium]